MLKSTSWTNLTNQQALDINVYLHTYDELSIICFYVLHVNVINGSRKTIPWLWSQTRERKHIISLIVFLLNLITNLQRRFFYFISNLNYLGSILHQCGGGKCSCGTWINVWGRSRAGEGNSCTRSRWKTSWEPLNDSNCLLAVLRG